MKFDWNSFGISPAPSVDCHTISQVQKLLGVALPNSFLDLAKYSDEAIPEISTFPYGENVTCISEFFLFSPSMTPCTISWYSGAGSPAGLPNGMIPIARDAGGYLVCLNFATFTITVEIFDPNSGRACMVANNFDDSVKLWSE